MRGDLVLFKYIGVPIVDWAIHRATNGPYAHVEIDIGNGFFASSAAGGLYIHRAIPYDGIIHIRSTFGPVGVDTGIHWVLEEVEHKKTHEYGWLDILSDSFKVLHIPFFVGQTNHWDCSDFVTQYLVRAGAADPLGDLATTPELVSPNDLARCYKVSTK